MNTAHSRPRVARAMGYAVREQHLGPVLRVGVVLIVVGTAVYAIGNGWSVVDSLYFSVATLTTSTIADPDLVLRDQWLKLFTIAYIVVGIGVLVETGRRIATAFVATRGDDGRENA
ncbi:MAG TPA: potassium channel family protein [Casimicrobiaceae bacterium]